MSAEGPQGRLRILCVHGFRQSAASLRGRLAGLQRKLRTQAEFVFVDGPFLVLPPSSAPAPGHSAGAGAAGVNSKGLEHKNYGRKEKDVECEDCCNGVQNSKPWQHSNATQSACRLSETRESSEGNALQGEKRTMKHKSMRSLQTCSGGASSTRKYAWLVGPTVKYVLTTAAAHISTENSKGPPSDEAATQEFLSQREHEGESGPLPLLPSLPAPTEGESFCHSSSCQPAGMGSHLHGPRGSHADEALLGTKETAGSQDMDESPCRRPCVVAPRGGPRRQRAERESQPPQGAAAQGPPQGAVIEESPHSQISGRSQALSQPSFGPLQHQTQTEGLPLALSYLTHVLRERGPFQGVLGFSQGCAVVAALAAEVGCGCRVAHLSEAVSCLHLPSALHGFPQSGGVSSGDCRGKPREPAPGACALKHGVTSCCEPDTPRALPSLSEGGAPHPRLADGPCTCKPRCGDHGAPLFFIFCSGFVPPGPGWERLWLEGVDFPSLHVYGVSDGADRQISPSESQSLAGCFRPSSRRVLTHSCGHIVPITPDCIQAFKTFLEQFQQARAETELEQSFNSSAMAESS